MPAPKRKKPEYQRGAYRLERRAGRTNYEIIWYDAASGRERSSSTGTGDLGRAKTALDALYLAGPSAHICPHCRRPWDRETEQAPLLTLAIADYLVLGGAKAGIASARYRLGWIVQYIAATDPGITPAEIDETWAERFRKWMTAIPVTSTKGLYLRERSASHVEGCLMQLAAVINAIPGQIARFKPQQMSAVSNSPVYRADVKTIAAMFRYALEADYRSNLLLYLQMAVASWARPEAILELKSDQWYSTAHVLDLNPKGRRQTKKHRPLIPVASQLIPLLDDWQAKHKAKPGNWITVTTIRGTWDKMRVKLDLPGNRESGPKLIRRSMATIARRRIGEANWIQGQMMLGHVKTSTSDIYALPDPANLGLALSVTESIIDEIIALVPRAFHRNHTAYSGGLKLVEGGKNG